MVLATTMGDLDRAHDGCQAARFSQSQPAAMP